MKTALDVIKRIQWDEMMPPESFTIGYLDRFTGLVEDEFSKFSNWGNLVSLKSLKWHYTFCSTKIGHFHIFQSEADYEALAIPQHRIEYFKYRGTKVWDKKSRLDLVFGSAGDNKGKSIEEIMSEIDEK